jgi:hypothetical protein
MDRVVRDSTVSHLSMTIFLNSLKKGFEAKRLEKSFLDRNSPFKRSNISLLATKKI